MGLPNRPQKNLKAKRNSSAPTPVNKYRWIVENAPEILALIGSTGIIQCVNRHTTRVLGYSAREVEGRNIFDFIHPEDAPRAAQEFSDTVQHEGERIPSVIRLRDSSGSWIPFEIIANNQLQDSATQSIVFAARDLRFQKDIEDAIRFSNVDIDKEAKDRTTELARINAALRIENRARHDAEIYLQHSVSLLNATLDSTADGILVVSNEGKVTSCNRKFFEMWRIGSAFSVGKDDHELLVYVIDQLQSPNDFLGKVRGLYANPSVSSFDVLDLKDGRIYERYSQPQRLDDKIVGRVWSFRDVTRTKNLEAELRQSQKMEALGRLAGGIAHDFNNLLMLISGYASQLLDNPLPMEAHSTCEQILAITKRASSVTGQLLTFSRKLPDTPTIVDLNVLVMDMERMLRRLVSDQIHLQLSVSSDPQPVLVDVSQVEMMIMNLAINAQDAMPEGGLLSIATTSEVLSTYEAYGNEKTNAFAVLEVSDTGHGMTPEVQAHIFEPFFTTKELGKGTGLGLSTVYAIAERAGGHIEVDTAPTQGTIFRVYLPRVSAAQSISSAVPDALPPVGGSETILLAEDESGIRALTRVFLEGLGYRVIEAADGTEAIRLAQEYAGTIDLVLSDILMPGIRGDAALNEIRKHRPKVKAMFMSGYTGQDAGSNAYNILYKPFEFPELGRRLRSILDDNVETRRAS